MNNQEKMHNQALYNPNDPEIAKAQIDSLERLYDFNQTRPGQQALRQKLLHEMFAEIGDGCYVEPPLHANFGGKFVHLGDHVYANFNLTLVDDTDIYIGSGTLIGPNVTIATSGHPILPELRAQGVQFSVPVTIGKNCWIGAAVTIVPGITIGDNVVIGAGSIVTKNLPSNVVAYGDPC